MKRLLLVVFLCAGSWLAAQEDATLPVAPEDTTLPAAPGDAPLPPIQGEATLPPTEDNTPFKLYFVPTVGGEPIEREFFDTAVPREIRGPYYVVVNNPEEADFLVSMIINETGDDDNTAMFTLSLTTFADETPLLDLSWIYADMEEMYTWDIGSIFSPYVLAEDGSLLIGRGRNYLLFLGFRAGGSLSDYFFQDTATYDSGLSVGLGAQGGFSMEFRFFRFLSLQVEVDVLYEVFNAPRVIETQISRTHTTEQFSSLSLMFPVTARIPMPFGRFGLSPYFGAYFTLGLLGEGTTNPPVGIIGGFDVAFALGGGEFFVDMRYTSNFGLTTMGGGGPQYIERKANLSIGYRFGFFRKGASKQGAVEREAGITEDERQITGGEWQPTDGEEQPAEGQEQTTGSEEQPLDIGVGG
jgi:hypothetical protein